MKNRSQGPLFWHQYEGSTLREKRADAKIQNEPHQSPTHLSLCLIVLHSFCL